MRLVRLLYAHDSVLTKPKSPDAMRKRPARQGDLADAERDGQAYADADRATATPMGRQLVENPCARRTLGVSNNKRSDRQDEDQIIVKDQRGKK